MSLVRQFCLVLAVFGLSAFVPIQGVEEEIEGGPFIITKAKPEWSDKDISKALDKIAEFSKKVEARVPYQEIKEHGESLASIFKEFPEEAEIPDEVEITIKRVLGWFC